MKFNKEPNTKCSICGKEMYLKPARLKRVKNGITCSKECGNILKSKYMKSEQNHQFDLKGELNSSFKGNEIIHPWENLDYSKEGIFDGSGNELIAGVKSL